MVHASVHGAAEVGEPAMSGFTTTAGFRPHAWVVATEKRASGEVGRYRRSGMRGNGARRREA
jgi:hypothetical protein